MPGERKESTVSEIEQSNRLADQSEHTESTKIIGNQMRSILNEHWTLSVAIEHSSENANGFKE